MRSASATLTASNVSSRSLTAIRSRRPAHRLAAVIFKSPFPDVDIPDVALSPFVLGKAERLGDKVAIVEAGSGRSYTYRQIADGVRQLAAGLHARGFRKGDVLAIMSPNLPEYPIAFHGVATAGVLNTTLNLTTPAE